MSEPTTAPRPEFLRSASATAAAAAWLSACGGGGSGGDAQTVSSNPVPGPAPVSTGAPAATPAVPLSAVQASRLLAQAAIGHGRTDITAATGLTVDAWLDAQFALPRGPGFWDFLVANGYDAPANANTANGFDAMVWSQLMGSRDLLRQRVGMALLSIWVVGLDGLSANWRAFTMAAYLDGLWDNAFGNWRDIMEMVSTSPAMAQYLTFLNNVKANTTTGAIPDENYARELMQLFSIGLVQLQPDGTPVLSGGNPVPSYTQADVSQHARVWTGYTLASTDNTTPARMRQPLAIQASRHETGAISFLGIDIPAGHDAATARKLALDGLFRHPNLPPFIGRQLIQRLVTSNPSPAYVARVAAAFIDNGRGVRGDMKTVIRAVLTDPEARDDAVVASTTFGKLREPVLRLVHWARAFGVSSPTNLWPFGNTASPANRLGQSPGRSPSVFNWFRPGYTPPGTTLAASGRVAPEFQITNEPSLVAYVNYMQSVITNGAGEAKPDYSALVPLASSSQALLDELNLVLAANQISAATLARMKTALDSIAVATPAGINNRIVAALVLVMACPEYLVLR